MENEIWKRINGLQGYLVSNFGNVKNQNGRIMKQITLQGGGYRVVNIKGNQIRVHKLVASMFIGFCPLGKEINHKDTNKENNHDSNLEYVTSGPFK